MKKSLLYSIAAFLVFLLSTCITPFTPRGKEMQRESLVIGGDIILNGYTKIFISLSRALDSDNKVIYVTNVSVRIEDTKGNSYLGFLNKPINAPSHFLFDTRAFPLDRQYKLCVRTQDGKEYESDFLTPLVSPPIDTIDFEINETNTAVEFFVTSYGDQNTSPYYKWNYIEDWEFTAKYLAEYYYDPNQNQIVPFTSPANTYYCWNQSESASILVAKTDHLENNTVYREKLNTIYNTSEKISYLYSIEVAQMSISKDAYRYWSNLKKNTYEIGGIFAPQPSEMMGNIRCVSDPDIHVLGYISAGTVSTKRIFVDAKNIGIYVPPSCPFMDLSEFFDGYNLPSNRKVYDIGGRVVGPVGGSPYSPNWGPYEVDWAPIGCVDCKNRGTKNKPFFWPNNHN